MVSVYVLYAFISSLCIQIVFIVSVKMSSLYTYTPIYQITKRHIDKYEPGQRIPRCQLSAEFKSVSAKAKPIPTLEHHVMLIGAKEPYNMFAIKPPASGWCAH